MKELLVCFLFMYGFALSAQASNFQDLSLPAEERYNVENHDLENMRSNNQQESLDLQYEIERQILAELTQASSHLAASEDDGKIPRLNQRNKEEYFKLSFNKPLIIFAFADWCGPCKMLNPTIKELDEERGDRYQFLKLDIDEQSEIAESLRIRAIPAIIVVENEKVKGSVVGFMLKQTLWDRIKEILND